MDAEQYTVLESAMLQICGKQDLVLKVLEPSFVCFISLGLHSKQG